MVLYVARVFDPARIPDDACSEGHLDRDPVYQVLLGLGQQGITGRLTIADAAGDNHMYFMQGRPVGVHLAEHFHPLGQLLLELGKMTGATFVRAQRLIAEGNRLPGQVYKELGILDDPGLKEVLAIQARRKAEHFCRLGSRPFVFCRGLTYLTGFTSTPLDAHGVIFLAVRQQMGEQQREGWLENARNDQVRLVVPGSAGGSAGGAPAPANVEHAGLPAPLAHYGFGAPEERFLQRILLGFESVAELAETGTLPRDEMAVLLRYLEVVGRLQRRPVPPPQPIPAIVPPIVAVPPVAMSPVPAPITGGFPVARQVSAMSARPPELAELQNLPLREATSDDVFSKPNFSKPNPAVPFDEEPLFSSPSDPTDPRRPAAVRAPARPPLPASPEQPTPAFGMQAAPNPLTEPTPPLQPSIVVSEELPAPVVKKKKVKRTEPLPSESSGVLVSETRREKTEISSLPTIVIDED